MIHAIRQYFARRAHVAAFIERNPDVDRWIAVRAANDQFRNPDRSDASAMKLAAMKELGS